MRLPRFKIRSLLGVVVFVAIAIAALRAADDLWDSGVLGLTLLSLLTAVLLAVHRTDRRRAYWLGFALFGWAYLVAGLIPQIGSRLPTTMGLAFIDSKIPGRQRAWVTTFLPYINTNAGTVSTNSNLSYVFTPQVNDISVPIQNNIWIYDATSGKPLVGPAGTTEKLLPHRALAPGSGAGVHRRSVVSLSVRDWSTTGSRGSACLITTILIDDHQHQIAPPPPLTLQKSSVSSGSLCLSTLIVHFLGRRALQGLFSSSIYLRTYRGLPLWVFFSLAL